MIILDAEGTIQRITDPARHLLEWAPHMRPPSCFFSWVHGRNLYQVMRDVADMVCHGKDRASWILGLRTGQGRWRWVKADVRNRLHDETGSITIVLYDLQDL